MNEDGRNSGTNAQTEAMRPEKIEATEASSGERLAAESDGAPNQIPRLAAGIELIGEYKESGYKKAPYIARRADGQTIQMPELLYQVAEEVDGKTGYGEIAERVTEKVQRGVSDDNIRLLVEEKLRPLGVVANADGSSPELRKIDPMLALKFRAALIPENVTHAITTIFLPLFFPPVVIAALAALIA